MTDTPQMSVCIPAYEMSGKGAAYLEQSFRLLKKQTFQRFEVIVSDQSSDDAVERLCKDWSKTLKIRHIWNRRRPRQASANLNNAMQHATASITKVLFQDDLIHGDHALQHIHDAFADPGVSWALCGSAVTRDGMDVARPMVPRLGAKLHYGKNTVSSPSVLALRSGTGIMFDESLEWLMDVAFYKELWRAQGEPVIVAQTLVLNRLHPDQVSARITPAIRNRELRRVRRRFGTQDGIAARLEFYRQMLKAR